MRLPTESLDELNAEACSWELLEPWDVHPDNARLERHAVYTFQARHVEQWRAGRVFVAGDAAHQMPPFAGQGMCAGIRDGANLAWKLDLVLAGQLDDDIAEHLLDSYETERLPSARQAIEFSMELGKVICVPDPVEAALRDEAMAGAVTVEVSAVPELPGIGNGFTHPEALHAGQLFGQCRIGKQLFDEVHGVGWRLVTLDAIAALTDDPLSAWFESLGGRVVGIDAPDAAPWLVALGARWFLQRPDFRLYGASPDASGAADLLHHLRHRLSASPR
jgi:hypothetical protein